MTEEDLDVVVGERAVVVQDLVEGVAERAGVGLAQTASLIGRVAVVLVVGDRALAKLLQTSPTQTVFTMVMKATSHTSQVIIL